MSADRLYWHVPGTPERAWHSAAVALGPGYHMASMKVDCGRWIEEWDAPGLLEHADRLPPTAHLCGSCARSIASRTDIEAPG